MYISMDKVKVAIIIAQLLYAYKFLQDVYFANALQLTIFAILTSQMAACSCKLVLYVYKFSRFHFRERPLICEFRKNKVPEKFVRIRYHSTILFVRNIMSESLLSPISVYVHVCLSFLYILICTILICMIKT